MSENLTEAIVDLLDDYEVDLNLYWPKKIIDACNNGGFGDEERGKASNWTTCACGECANIPDANYKPEDLILGFFGMVFYHAVKNDLFLLAANSLCIIEHRAALILFFPGMRLSRFILSHKSKLEKLDPYIDALVEDLQDLENDGLLSGEIYATREWVTENVAIL